MEIPDTDLHQVKAQLREHAAALGFGKLGVARIELAADVQHLARWLAAGRQGEMSYMERHAALRCDPRQLLPGTLRVISVRMDYWPGEARDAAAVLADPTLGYVSRYALGRDYHKVLRRGLKQLAGWLEQHAGRSGHRVCVDSAPVLEKALARDAGIGWIGQHTNLIAPEAGSWFFLGELLTDLPLPPDEPASAHCGSCQACMPACPTAAITGPKQLDARRCISYLTIEHQSAIPVALRPAIGNRIYGCDDCQLVCPWNKFARAATHPDFKVRHGLDAPRLTELFQWTAGQFEERMRGSAIHRLGHERWLRNIAVALGNAPTSGAVVSALVARKDDPSPLVREHVAWALERHGASPTG